VNAADLDALDRGVVEAGLLAAEALSRISALEAAMETLTRQFEQITRAEAILRRAGMPEPILAAADRKAERQVRRRSRHLKAIEEASRDR
jgi:hypothetical protein